LTPQQQREKRQNSRADGRVPIKFLHVLIQGPYQILARVNSNTYEVKPKYTKGKKLIVNQCRLSKCFTRDYENVTGQALGVVGDNPQVKIKNKRKRKLITDTTNPSPP